jgi:hypothetical protein
VEGTPVGEWPKQYAHVEEWLGYLKREVEIPDLWSTAHQQLKLIQGVASSKVLDNTPLSPEEQARIAAQLEIISKYLIENQALSEEQAEFVTEKLDYLEETSKRQGRRDWFSITLGVFFQIALAAAFAPDVRQEMFRLVSAMLQQLVSGIQSLPMP